MNVSRSSSRPPHGGRFLPLPPTCYREDVRGLAVPLTCWPCLPVYARLCRLVFRPPLAHACPACVCVQSEYEGVVNLVALAKNKEATKFVLVSPPWSLSLRSSGASGWSSLSTTVAPVFLPTGRLLSAWPGCLFVCR